MSKAPGPLPSSRPFSRLILVILSVAKDLILPILVILSGASDSRSESDAESKDPYSLNIVHCRRKAFSPPTPPPRAAAKHGRSGLIQPGA